MLAQFFYIRFFTVFLYQLYFKMRQKCILILMIFVIYIFSSEAFIYEQRKQHYNPLEGKRLILSS